MATPQDVTCPSGMTGRARGMKTREANLMSDPAAIRKGTTMDSLLAACWLSTDSPGPYALRPDGTVNWAGVLVGDRFEALIAIRVATYGSDYDFQLICQNAMCQEKFDWTIDLMADLERKSYSPEALEAFKAGTPFETELPDGRKATFRLLTGADEARAGKQGAGGDRALTVAVASRLVTIEGVHANDKLRAIDDMEMSDVTAILATLEKVDGGVETDIEVRCPHCSRVQEVSLPFGRAFFLPKAKKKTEEATPG